MPGTNSALPEEDAEYPVRIPEGVADPEGVTGAVSRGGGDVDLLDLVTGQRLARLAGAGHPLMFDRGALLGYRLDRGPPARLRLWREALPPQTPCENDLAALPLPDWLAPLDSAPGRDFSVEVARRGRTYALHWSARRQPQGGAGPPEFAASGPARAAGGAVLSDRSLEPLSDHAEAGRSDGTTRQMGEMLARTAGGSTYRQDGELRNAPWRTPAGPMFLRAGTQGLELAPADRPEGPAVLHLASADRGNQPPELSLDGRHIAVAGSTDADGVVAWHLYSTHASGRLATLRLREDFGSFCILAGRLLRLGQIRRPCPSSFTIRVERTLCAVDLGARRQTWSYALDPVSEPDPMFPPQ
jgi:hypothetical protein